MRLDEKVAFCFLYCRQENAIFSPHILTTWEGPFSAALYIFCALCFVILMEKRFLQESQISTAQGGRDGPPDIIYQPGKLRCASAACANGPERQELSAGIFKLSGQGADEYVRFKVQPVGGTKDPVSVSNYVDVTPGPGVQFNRHFEFKA